MKKRRGLIGIEEIVNIIGSKGRDNSNNRSNQLSNCIQNIYQRNRNNS